MLVVVFGADVVRIASGQGLAVRGGWCFRCSGIPSGVATACPLSLYLAGVDLFPVRLFSFIIFIFWGVYPVKAFLVSVAVVVLFVVVRSSPFVACRGGLVLSVRI